jgi:hypothetical protein
LTCHGQDEAFAHAARLDFAATQAATTQTFLESANLYCIEQ